ncbi:ABC transporter substrate-binding protein [Pararhizobium haloflavum]|uniref:ABC transporter substrate-binding protein n=1 Tax=Pararhizobium haloflavum TaxID=2037914 RepID=UPI0018E414F1|nr:ABC transporter substrate-binding protein [Pararhizobium haloflavum]
MLRKMLLASAATVVVTAATPALTQDADSLTIVSWGGAYERSQQLAYYEPFTEETGVEILQESESANGLAGIRSQVEAGNVSWDVVDLLQSDAQRACDEGLLEVIDPAEWLADGDDGTPPEEDFIENTMGDCFIPQILYATMFAYNTEAFPDGGPQTVEDIWDLEAFPGTRALQRIPQKNLEWALLADGVEPDQVYEVLATEEGQDQAFAKLDEIRDSVIWWEEGAQPPQLLADQEAVIATAYNGRIFDAQMNEDQPFEIMWDHQMFEVDGWVIPVGNEDELDTIKEFIRFSTDTQRLADQAQYIAYGPARNSSASKVSTFEGTDIEMAPHMPTNPENLETAIAFDVQFWADYGDALEERFNAWLAQ